MGTTKRFLPVGFVAIALIGCGADNTGRQAISGTVTFRGLPLDRGTIQFLPVSEGQGSGALIRDGKYSIPQEKGLEPGTYRILISSGEPGAKHGAEEAPGMSRPLSKERIPETYNLKSNKQVEVKPTGSNTFDFTID
jgi:hypothetical protein